MVTSDDLHSRFTILSVGDDVLLSVSDAFHILLNKVWGKIMYISVYLYEHGKS